MSVTKKIKKKMTARDKVAALDMLLDSFNLPAIVLLKHEGRSYGRNSDITTEEDALDMLAGYIITAAEVNGLTPIKILSNLGEVIQEQMNEIDRRTKEANKKVIKTAEPAKRS